jgi:NADH dehydrogenase
MQEEERRRPRVVIIGGGFAGLEAARALKRSQAEVILIDRNNYHCFQPLLYQVATAALSPGEIAWPIRYLRRADKNLSVYQAEVDAVDLAARVVHAGPHAFAFDHLIVASGATHSYFGHSDWAEHAPGLKRIEDATAIRRRILGAFEAAELAPPEDQSRLLTFVVVGGGPTGVEMAGAIAEVARLALPRDFRRIDTATARILLVEAGPRLLAAFPDELSAYAAKALAAQGVEVLTGTAVEACRAEGVMVGGQLIPAAVTVWAAGVRASPAAAWLSAASDRAGRVMVEPDLSLPGQPDIFVVGDVAAVTGEGGRPVPGIAPAAKQMGRHAARVIAARIAGRPGPKAFRYRHYGDLATIGRNAAVVSLGRWRLTGFIAWLFWSLAHVYFLIDPRSRLSVAVTWAWSYVTHRRGARLIVGGGADEAPPAPATAPGDAKATLPQAMARP